MQLWALSWSQMDPLEETKGLTCCLLLFWWVPGQDLKLWWGETEGHAGFIHLRNVPFSFLWLITLFLHSIVQYLLNKRYWKGEKELIILVQDSWQAFYLILKTHLVLNKPSLGPPFLSNYPTLSKSTWTVSKKDNIVHSPKEKSWLKNPACQADWSCNWSAEPLLAQVLGSGSRPFLPRAVAATWEKHEEISGADSAPTLCTGPALIPNSTCITNS